MTTPTGTHGDRPERGAQQALAKADQAVTTLVGRVTAGGAGLRPAGRPASASGSTGPGTRQGRTALLRPGRLIPLVLLVVLIFLPWMRFSVPGVLPGLVNSPGSMRLLAMCLVTAGIALSYDVLFGRTGLLSFGHALFVGAGAYVAAITLQDWGSLVLSLLAVLVVGVALPLLVGAVSLRVKGIAFAMVTLAFAQAVAITVTRNPGGATGGEEGLPLSRDGLPDFLLGVANAPYRYWVALAFCVLCLVVVGALGRSRTGAAWAAVRENEGRVEVLGVSSYRAKLLSVLVGGLLGTIGGMVQLLVVGGTSPAMLSVNFTLSMLVMVVLGGAGSRWGAVIGGALYALLDSRLGELATSQTIADLPGVLRVPLSQPLFVFGLLFILIVYFAPGGITSIGRRLLGAVTGRRAAPDPAIAQMTELEET
jgi:branched-chain amino acid transport system permease protein